MSRHDREGQKNNQKMSSIELAMNLCISLLRSHGKRKKIVNTTQGNTKALANVDSIFVLIVD